MLLVNSKRPNTSLAVSICVVAMTLITFLVLLAVFLQTGTTQNCPTEYGSHPVLLVSLDGFRAEYLQRGLTPNIKKLQDEGASAPYMKASFPTITFPNHYTIATGLYPESHGIIANHFYDPNFGAEFDLGSEESLKGRWWGGEPIWNTVLKQDKLSAAFFWPGSDAFIEDMHPTHFYMYDYLIPFSTRVQQVLLWLSLPESSRPSWISLYFDEPDHTGHSYGPNSPELSDMLVEVDSVIGELVTGLSTLNITDCVNLILVADHGMTEAGEARIIELTNYVPDLDNLGVTYKGAFVRIDVDEQYEGETDEIRRNFTCQRPELRQYIASGMPKRFHFSNNPRIEDIILDLTLGYTGNVDSGFFLEGEHGYDNYYTDMEPIFIASGPEFQKGVMFEPFQNIELYNLMCYLVGVPPAPNNGTEASLNHLLVSPPAYPILTPETPPPSPPFPSDSEIDAQMHVSGCPADDIAPLNLNFSTTEEDAFRLAHLPWGIPLSGALPASFILLHQEDHVTGYSELLRMALWTSFTIEGNIPEPPKANWSSDVRLTTDNSPTCQDYDALVPLNITMKTLFPNRFGSNSVSGDLSFIISNAVAVSNQLIPHWKYLLETLLIQWVAGWGGPTNVVIGPVFDFNADSLVDNYTSFNSSPPVPSHLFLIASRCNSVPSSILSDCPVDGIDSIAFIYPQFIDIENCLTEDFIALENSAKVKDVELITGLTFFPDLPYKDRTQVAIRIHSSLWSTTFN